MRPRRLAHNYPPCRPRIWPPSGARRETARPPRWRDFYATIDWNAARGLRNIFGKALTGTAGDRITEAQRAELARKRLNVYAYVGFAAIEAEGWTTKSGIWIDQRFAAYWLDNEIRQRVWAYMSPRTIGGTDADISAVVGIIDAACAQGRHNGVLAPGTVDATVQEAIIDATGDSGFDGELPNGYLIHAPLAASRSEADRATRRLPGINVWATGSKYINGVTIGIRFS